MTLEEIEAALTRALAMRVPRLSPDDGTGRKVEQLQDYMLDSAYANGDLVAARHWLRMLRHRLADAWERLDGWEIHTTKPRARLTAADIQRCKIKTAPAKYEAGRKAKLLAESIDDQISRFEREERVCSRAYTMLTGS